MAGKNAGDRGMLGTGLGRTTSPSPDVFPTGCQTPRGLWGQPGHTPVPRGRAIPSTAKAPGAANPSVGSHGTSTTPVRGQGTAGAITVPPLQQRPQGLGDPRPCSGGSRALFALAWPRHALLIKHAAGCTVLLGSRPGCSRALGERTGTGVRGGGDGLVAPPGWMHGAAEAQSSRLHPPR